MAGSRRVGVCSTIGHHGTRPGESSVNTGSNDIWRTLSFLNNERTRCETTGSRNPPTWCRTSLAFMRQRPKYSQVKVKSVPEWSQPWDQNSVIRLYES